MTGQRWTMRLNSWQGKRVPVQRLHGRDSQALTIPEPIARLAYEEYAAQFGRSQSFERLHERGGFGTMELICLLADLVERREEVFRKAKVKS